MSERSKKVGIAGDDTGESGEPDGGNQNHRAPEPAVPR
jgi:hypothetical protein